MQASCRRRFLTCQASRGNRLIIAVRQYLRFESVMEIVNLVNPDFETALHQRTQSDSAYYARVARLLLDLLDKLRHEPIGPRVYAFYYIDGDLRLQYSAPSHARCMITITIDRPDYGPLVDGLPQFHYRMTCQITDSIDNRIRPATEERKRNVDSAVEFVRNAIRETRMLP